MSTDEQSLDPAPEDLQASVDRMQEEVKQRQETPPNSPKHGELTRSIDRSYRFIQPHISVAESLPASYSPYGLAGEARSTTRNDAIQETERLLWEKVNSSELIDVVQLKQMYLSKTFKHRLMEQEEDLLGIRRVTEAGKRQKKGVTLSADASPTEDGSSLLDTFVAKGDSQQTRRELWNALHRQFGEIKLPGNPGGSLLEVMEMKEHDLSIEKIAKALGSTPRKVDYFWKKHAKELRDYLILYGTLLLCMSFLE
jgi:hypothetical protein